MSEVKQLQELAVWFLDSSEELPKRLVYVYYCEICNSILALRSELQYRQTILNDAVSRCPNCHFSLDATIRCRAFKLRIPISVLPRTRRGQLLPSNCEAPRNSFPVFESVLNATRSMSNTCPIPNCSSGAGEIPLRFEVKELDEICGGLNRHHFAILHGDKVAQAIVERLCVRSQLPVDEGGFDAASVFIDGGNTFDVYHVSQYAATLHLNRDEALRKIQVSRAFTCYQLVNLIIDKLPILLSQHNIGLVTISNILDLFLDSEIDEEEVKHAINFLSNFLAQLARAKRIAVIVTCSAQEKLNAAVLRQFLTSRANVVLRAEQHGREMQFTLEKHPTKRPAARIIRGF